MCIRDSVYAIYTVYIINLSPRVYTHPRTHTHTHTYRLEQSLDIGQHRQVVHKINSLSSEVSKLEKRDSPSCAFRCFLITSIGGKVYAYGRSVPISILSAGRVTLANFTPGHRRRSCIPRCSPIDTAPR